MAYFDKYGVEFSDDRKTLVKCPRDFQGEYVIPDEVTSIGNKAFNYCESLFSIIIPNSVTSIGKSAFGSCKGLTSVEISNSITNIEKDAFFGCVGITSVVWNAKKLKNSNDVFDLTFSSDAPFFSIRSQITSFAFGANVEAIPNYLCYGMNLLSSVSIPDSVTSIGYSAFGGCSGLKNVTIGNNVTSIGNGAFDGCIGLTKIELPNSVTLIGGSTFSGCSGLTSVELPNSITNIGKDVFRGCIGITSIKWDAKTTKKSNDNFDLSLPPDAPFFSIRSQITSLIFGDAVEDIPKYLCYGMNNLSSISIPNSVTSIGNNAFEGCTALTKIEIPNNVTSIGYGAFKGCSTLSSIEIPNSVKCIGGAAFAGCFSLKSVTIYSHEIVSQKYSTSWTLSSIFDSNVSEYVIGDGVTGIGAYAFYQCSNLLRVIIPNSVTNIGNSTFEGCAALKSITIPKSVTSIGQGAFFRCSGLSNIIVDPCNPVYDSRSNCNALVETASNMLVVGCADTIIPLGIASIKKEAFYGCSNLKSVIIPDSVTCIGGCAFSNCSSLTKITIPKNVKSIGENAFSHCSNLTSVTINSNTIVSRQYDVISSIRSIFGVQVSEYIIGDDITRIGEYAFYGCKDLASVKIGNNVTSIEHAAFSGCSHLTSVNIPNSIISIGSEAFYGSGLTILKIDNSVTSIGWSAFCHCSSLKSIEIPNSITYIADSMFHGCSNLKTVIIPDSVTSIGEEVFNSCHSLVSIVIPDSVTEIGTGNFCDCEKLRSVVLGNGIKHIGNCFENCESLSSVVCAEDLRISQEYNYLLETKWFSLQRRGTITLGATLIFYRPSKDKKTEHYKVPDNILYIAKNAFDYCNDLKSIDFNKTQIVDCELPDSVSAIMASGGALQETESFDNTIWYKNHPEGYVYIGNLLYRYKTSTGEYPSVVQLDENTHAINKRAFYEEDVDRKYQLVPFVVICNENLAYIGESAFENSSITEIIIPYNDYLTKIPPRAFKNTLLCNINFSDIRWRGIQEIGEEAFAECKLSSIFIPASVEVIARGAFQYNNSLENVYISDGIRSLQIGDYAFSNCDLRSVYIPERVEKIVSEAFGGEHIKNYCHAGKYTVLYGRHIINTLIIHCNLDCTWQYGHIGTLIFEEGVTSIVENAFYSSLIENIIFPSTLQEIKYGAFGGLDNLKTLHLPSSITELWANSLPVNIRKVILSSGKLLLKIADNRKEWLNKLIANKVFVDENGNDVSPELMIYRLNDNIKSKISGNVWRPEFKDIVLNAIKSGEFTEVKDFEEPYDKETSSSDEGRDKPSYSQYGGYNGYDDDTIDSAFEGDPEATWNID